MFIAAAVNPKTQLRRSEMFPWTRSARGADGGFFRLTLDDHQRDVVGGAYALRKFRQRGFDPVANARRRGVDIARDYFVESCRSELLSCGTRGFGHTVGIDDEHIP